MKDSDLSPEEVKQPFQALWIGFEVAGLQFGVGFYRLGACSVNWGGEQANTSATWTAFGTFGSFSFGHGQPENDGMARYVNSYSGIILHGLWSPITVYKTHQSCIRPGWREQNQLPKELQNGTQKSLFHVIYMCIDRV